MTHDLTSSGLVAAILWPVAWFWLVPQVLDLVTSLWRRAREQPFTVPAQTLGRAYRTVDVGKVARGSRRRSQGRFLLDVLMLECAGGLALGAAVNPGTWVLAGLCFQVALRRSWFEVRDRRGKLSAASVSVLVASSLLTFLGIAAWLYGWIVVSIVLESGGPLADGRLTAVALALPPLVTIGLVTGAAVLARWAGRLRLSRVRTVRSPLAPILYLRAFADDALTMRVAPFQRLPLAERLSPQRRQGFEEILGEELNTMGPVQSIARPGVDLGPLGFSRDVLDDEHWQAGVLDRMRRARAVVTVVGDGPGLVWELQNLISSGTWARMILVFPPVPLDDLDERWERVRGVLTLGGIRGVHLPPRCRRPLAMRFEPDTSCVIYCADRAEPWEYKTAIRAALSSRSTPPLVATEPTRGPGTD